jgi:hypothetical protein
VYNLKVKVMLFNFHQSVLPGSQWCTLCLLSPSVLCFKVHLMPETILLVLILHEVNSWLVYYFFIWVLCLLVIKDYTFDYDVILGIKVYLFNLRCLTLAIMRHQIYSAVVGRHTWKQCYCMPYHFHTFPTNRKTTLT